MRWIVRRDDADLVQRQRRFGRFARAKVSVVNRVERAAEHAEATLRCSCLAADACGASCGSDQICRFASRASGIGDPPSARAAAACHDLLPRGFEQRVHAFAGRAGDLEERQLPLLDVTFQRLHALPDRPPRPSCSRRRSAAWPRPPARTARSSSRIVSKSSTGSRPDAPETSTRWTSTFVRSMWRRNWWPRPWPSCAPLIRPGHVGDDEAAIVAQRHDAEVGRERRERVVGDLRTRRGDPRDQRGLAGVGESDQADVGNQLQLQPKLLLFARLRPARSGAARDWWTRRNARCRARRGRLWRRARAGPPPRDRRAGGDAAPSGSFSKTSVPIGTAISRSSAVCPVRFDP